jgi:hypothetical protein
MDPTRFELVTSSLQMRRSTVELRAHQTTAPNVGGEGIEPSTSALDLPLRYRDIKIFVRVGGIEPPTSALSEQRSTTELHALGHKNFNEQSSVLTTELAAHEIYFAFPRLPVTKSGISFFKSAPLILKDQL